jgi:hypothetical protein
MITMLNSWSFDLNSNKSVGTPDPSIPVLSHGHSACQNLRLPILGGEVSRFSGPLVGALLRWIPNNFGTFPFQRVALGVFGHSIINWSLGFEPWTFSSVLPSLLPVNALNRPVIHACNPLIARVRTVSHENKIFFSEKCRAIFLALTHVRNL